MQIKLEKKSMKVTIYINFKNKFVFHKKYFYSSFLNYILRIKSDKLNL